jgi:superfamily II DNA or RNA helicase
LGKLISDNPFKDEAFIYIASIDFLKQNHIMKMMMDSNFDLVVVDEAHELSYGTERFSLGQLLSQKTNFLLFLTATPHNGIDEEFLQRMKFLDPYFHQLSTTSHLITRNIKEDVVDLDGKEVFPPRETKRIDIRLTDGEIHLHKNVDDYISERLQEASNVQELNAIRFLTIIIRKRASSSIRALKNTFQKRIKKLGTTENIENTIQQMKRNEEDVDEEAVGENEEQIVGYTLARIPKEKEEISDILQTRDIRDVLTIGKLTKGTEDVEFIVKKA